MQSPLTLHDFVLNLLSDAGARAAFDLDPDGALKAAGLTGVTPADVRDVIPLVADYAPAHLAGPHRDLPAFGSNALGANALGANTLGANTLSANGVGAGIHPLQVTAASLPGDASLAAAGGLRVTADAGHVAAVSAHGAAAGDFSTGDFSAAHDLAGTLDPVGAADPVGTVTGAAPVPDVLGGHPLGTDPLGQVTGTAHSLDPGHLLHDTGLDHGLDTGLDNGLTGALPGAVGGVTSGLTDPLGGTGLAHDATTPLHGVTAPLGVGGNADADQSTSGHADAHLLDLPLL
jgi:hypothetical protein